MMDKEKRYGEVIQILPSLIEGVKNNVGVLANCAALIKEKLEFFWVGFYMVEGEKLILGPFQGPVACYEIGYGRGVCGSAWKERRTLVVKDVEEFPGHIACSSLSRSEIVVPIFDATGKVCAVLDIDSKDLACFDETDRHYLEQAMQTLTKAIYR